MSKQGTHKRKGDFVSETCALKNLIKYASYTSWESRENIVLLSAFKAIVVESTKLEGKGWLAKRFGEVLVSNKAATNEILLMISALLAYSRSVDETFTQTLQLAWSRTPFFTLDIKGVLVEYLKPNGGIGKGDLDIADCTIDELAQAFANPSSVLTLIRDTEQKGLRQRWIKGSKKQLKPIEIKLLRMLACLLLGAPTLLHEGEGVGQLLIHAFDTSRNPIKKYIGEYWKLNDWLKCAIMPCPSDLHEPPEERQSEEAAHVTIAARFLLDTISEPPDALALSTPTSESSNSERSARNTVAWDKIPKHLLKDPPTQIALSTDEEGERPNESPVLVWNRAGLSFQDDQSTVSLVGSSSDADDSVSVQLQQSIRKVVLAISAKRFSHRGTRARSRKGKERGNNEVAKALWREERAQVANELGFSRENQANDKEFDSVLSSSSSNEHISFSNLSPTEREWKPSYRHKKLLHGARFQPDRKGKTTTYFEQDADQGLSENETSVSSDAGHSQTLLPQNDTPSRSDADFSSFKSFAAFDTPGSDSEQEIELSQALHEAGEQIVRTIMKKLRSRKGMVERAAVQRRLEAELDSIIPAKTPMRVTPTVETAKQKDANKLLKNVLDLSMYGSTITRRITGALLIGSMTVDKARNYLLDNGYTKQRQEQVVKNIKQRNEVKRNAAVKQNEAKRKKAAKLKVELNEADLVVLTDDDFAPEVCKKQFAAPLSNWRTTTALRKDYATLVEGKDIQKRRRATKITFAQADKLAEFVAKKCQFRPGQTRNSVLLGVRMKQLPCYVRYGSLGDLYTQYKSFAGDISVGSNTFRKAMKAITKRGTYNSGLSYFWVDFIELTELALECAKRLEWIADHLKDKLPRGAKKEIEAWTKSSKKITKFTSVYLRHEYYQTLQKSSCNGYKCMQHALGQMCTHQHEFSEDDKLTLALTSHVVLAKAVHVAQAHLKNMEPLPGNPQADLIEELDSMKKLAKLMQKEVFHYTKHQARGWWQSTAEKELTEQMRGKPHIKMCKSDHKNKTLAQTKHEAMSEYFSKHGISDCGTFMYWWGEEDGSEGWYCWCIDMIMENTTSQEARDVSSCMEVLVLELLRPEFVAIAGKTSEMWLSTDNALTSAELSVFLTLLNRKFPQIQFKRWDNAEAQRSKGQVDTHFAMLNIWITKAVMDDLKLSCPRTMYDCCTYDGGIKANTVLLVRELNAAQDIFDQCKACLVKKDKEGIKSIHSQIFAADTLTMTNFTNLNTGLKVLDTKRFDSVLTGLSVGKEVPVEELPEVSEVLRRHQSKKGVSFIPITPDTGEADTVDVPDSNTLAGRLYPALKKWSTGIQFDIDEITDPDDHDIDDEIQDMKDMIKSLYAAEADLFNEYGVTSWPPTLPFYWAKKKNRTYLTLADVVKQMLAQMYNQGMGYSNKNLRYTAEQARSQLLETLLKSLWDQRYICSVGRVKAVFGTKYREEQKNNDNEGNQDPALIATNVLEGNKAAENKLLTLMKKSETCSNAERIEYLKLAKISHFAKLSPSLLMDFIIARMLMDASDTSLDATWPKKGTAKMYKEGIKCLLGMAYDLRKSAVIAKRPQATPAPALTQMTEQVLDELFQTSIDTEDENAEDVEGMLVEAATAVMEGAAYLSDSSESDDEDYHPA